MVPVDAVVGRPSRSFGAARSFFSVYKRCYNLQAYNFQTPGWKVWSLGASRYFQTLGMRVWALGLRALGLIFCFASEGRLRYAHVGVWTGVEVGSDF